MKRLTPKLEASPFDLPLDLDHAPADLPEAIEMLRRAKRRLRFLEMQCDDHAAALSKVQDELAARRLKERK